MSALIMWPLFLSDSEIVPLNSILTFHQWEMVLHNDHIFSFENVPDSQWKLHKLLTFSDMTNS